jgi:hypothetical protein
MRKVGRNIANVEKAKRWGNGKNRKHANMGLSRFFEYCNEEDRLIFDLGLRDIFDL